MLDRTLLSVYRRGRGVLERRGLLKSYQRLRRIVPNPIGSYLKSRAIEVHGRRMFIDSQDASGILRHGFYERPETRLVEQRVRRGDVVVDIGANIGYYTLLLASLVGERGRVYAFEPDPANFALLKRNVDVNGFNNVTLVQRAVADVSGKTRLYWHDWTTMHSTLRFDVDRGSVEIETVALDDYFEGRYGRVDFVKLDIGGAEVRALRGMRSTLNRNTRISILAELYPFGLKRFGVEPKDYLNEFVDLGFAIWRVNEEGRPSPVDIEGLLATYTPQNEWACTNLLCTRGDVG